MKHILNILLLLTIGFTACQRDTAYPHAMQQAEGLMSTRPDSALHLLEGMSDTLAMLPEEARMYYHLLTIQAKDKQYITHTSDSLINRIVSYYEESGDKERLMKAYYYQGSTYRDMNDAPRALKAFQQALDLNVPNYDLQAKAYNQMGTLFMYQGLHDEVIRVNRKSIELYLSQGKRNKISYAQRDIARMYSAKNVQDSALHYYQEACQTALEDRDSIRYYGILGELGSFHYEIGNVDLAKRILLFVKRLDCIDNKTHIYTMLGHLYNNENQSDSAKYYYQNAAINGDIYHAYNNYRHSFILASNKGDYAEAITSIKKALHLKDSIDQITNTETVARINALYNFHHTEVENAYLRLSKEIYKTWVLILSFIILLILSLVICINLHKKRNKEHKLRITEFKKSQLYKEIWLASNEEDSEYFNSPEKWVAIQENIDFIYPRFTDKLYQLSPSLTPTELRVCWLTKIGIPPAGIARILNLSKQAISNARSRLSKKMQEVDNARRSFDQLIENL